MSKIVCDQSLCSGCLACVVACIDQHYDESETNAVSPRIYEKYTSSKTGLVRYSTRNCLHCEDAPCIKACPRQVLTKNDQGFVLTPNQEQCIGCKACLSACPHNVPRFNSEGKIVKCDGCWARVACGLEPACMRACPTGALSLE